MENNNFQFNALALLLLIKKWKKELLIITSATFILSYAATFLITPKFESTVVMFPPATNSVSKTLLSLNFGGKDDILGFGESEETEQMLQILHSSDLRNLVVQKFNLMNHYEIDPESEYKNTKLIKKYEKNIQFKRTEFMGVSINVLDSDPQLACDIANGIASLYDSIKNSMQRERTMQAYKIVEKEYQSLEDQVKKMEDSLTVLRKLGVNDYESQAEVLNDRLANEIAKGNKSGIDALQKQIDILAQYGSAYVSLRDALEYEKKRLSEMKGKFEEAKVDAFQAMPQKFIVERAFKAEKKAYPVRSIIVLISVFSVFLLSLILLILIEHNIISNPLQRKV